MTTNEGTPTNATIEPWSPPITAQTATAMTMAISPLYWWPLPGSCSSATTSAPIPARYPIDRSISPRSSTNTTPNREHRRARHLDDHVAEVDGREEVRRRVGEEDDDDDLADDDRDDPEVARPDVGDRAIQSARMFVGVCSWGASAAGARRERPARRRRQCSRGVAPAPPGMPATFVGTPAVIAATTPAASWPALEPPTFRPSRRTVIRSAVSKMSWRLCEMITTARPCWPRRRTSSSTCSVCATPRAAVGSSRTTSFEFHCTAFATATDWRWPPESVATGCRMDVDRRDGERLERLRGVLLHLRLVEDLEPVHLTAEVHVLDDVEVVAEREILVHDLDAEVGASFGSRCAPPGPRR